MIQRYIGLFQIIVEVSVACKHGGEGGYEQSSKQSFVI
jgi:hypothetical protein